MFYSSSGILVAKTMRHAYDALKWSLYRKVSTSLYVYLILVVNIHLQGDTYHVHFFQPRRCHLQASQWKGYSSFSVQISRGAGPGPCRMALPSDCPNSHRRLFRAHEATPNKMPTDGVGHITFAELQITSFPYFWDTPLYGTAPLSFLLVTFLPVLPSN